MWSEDVGLVRTKQKLLMLWDQNNHKRFESEDESRKKKKTTMQVKATELDL